MYEFTIFTPCYNSASTIERTFNSILKLQYDLNKIEWLVVDNKSEDETLNIVKKIKKEYQNLNIKIIAVDKNKGINNSFNLGALYAEGTYWINLDSDDEIKENALSDFWSIFKKYEKNQNIARVISRRETHENPIETYETNVIGTLKVFEACRKNNVKVIVNITSDKAYENKEWIWGYRENDPMGGYDPYSSSKGCADILANSYRSSYFNPKEYKKTHNTLLASCRAGNVIGGGDWAKDRLITDIMLSVSQNKKVSIRNPYATRPWQHVLEPLSGYLHIGQKLLEEKVEFGEAWNFGPSEEGSITVEEVVKNIKKHWDKIDYEINSDSHQLHEANLLKLDCSKAHILLKWKDVWDSETTFEKTVKWYRSYYEKDKRILTAQDLKSYIADAKAKNIEWAIS